MENVEEIWTNCLNDYLDDVEILDDVDIDDVEIELDVDTLNNK